MKRWEAWWNHAALAAVSLSGLVYGIFKYLVPNPDPDSRIGHPWQPAVMKAHVLAAPLALFAIGLIFRRHALVRMRGGERSGRRTGAVLFWMLSPLALTGYLIQVFVESAAVRAAAWTHLGLGTAFLVAYAFHPKRSAPSGAAGDNGNGNGNGT